MTGSAAITNNEVDFFRVTTQVAGAYTFETTTPFSNVDTVIGVYNTAGQRLALILWSALAAKGILFTDSHGKERIEPQKIMIVEILVACSQAQQTLGDQFAHGVFDKERITRIVKAAAQGSRDAQTLIDLTQEQHPCIAAEIAGRKVGHDLARTQIVKAEEQGLRTDSGLGKRI